MGNKTLIMYLNRFLALERQQVSLYKGQARRTKAEHLRRALELFADIEGNHVKNLSREIKRLGGDHNFITKLADDLGNLVGQATQVTGVKAMLHVNILIEGRAAYDYAGILANLPPGPTQDLLWQHQLEEELHRAWMIQYLKNHLNQGKSGSKAK